MCTVEHFYRHRKYDWSTWYCCSCGEGPFNRRLNDRCIGCHHELSACATHYEARLVTPKDVTAFSHGKSISSAFRKLSDSAVSLPSARDSPPSFLSPPQRPTSEAHNIEHHASLEDVPVSSNFKRISKHPSRPDEGTGGVEESRAARAIPFTPKSSWASSQTYYNCATTQSDSGSQSKTYDSITESSNLLTERVFDALRFSCYGSLGILVCTTDGDATIPSAPPSSQRLRKTIQNVQSRDKTTPRRLKGPNDNSEQENSDEDLGKRLPKRLRTDSSGPKTFGPQLACIFLKRHPNKYIHLSCGKKGWPEVHRMKEHIYRCHRIYSCDHCYEPLQTKDGLMSFPRHKDQCRRCEQGQMRPEEGIDDEKEKQLRSRSGLKGLDEVKRWNKVNRIVFGSDTAYDPAPYFDRKMFRENNQRDSSDDVVSRTIRIFKSEILRQLPMEFETIIQKHRHLFSPSTAVDVDHLPSELVIPLTDGAKSVLDRAAATFEQNRMQDDLAPPRRNDGSEHDLSQLGSVPPLTTALDLAIGNLDFSAAFGPSRVVQSEETTTDGPASRLPNDFILKLDRRLDSHGSDLPENLLSLEAEPSYSVHGYNTCTDNLMPPNIMTMDCNSTLYETSDELLISDQDLAPKCVETQLLESQQPPLVSSAVQQTRLNRFQAATKGMDSLPDLFFDTGNLFSDPSSTFQDSFAEDNDSSGDHLSSWFGEDL